MLQDLDVSLQKVEKEKLKAKPDQKSLGFGQYFTDHMFLMKWDRQEGWHEASICPFADFSISPAAMVLHYGQAIFEGMKAYRSSADEIFLFRPTDNLDRMNLSATRMCMPRFPVDKVLKSLKALLYLERDWVPSEPGASLYIRPTMVAMEPLLGVKPAGLYYFFIILCPVGAYYPEGFNPTKIYVSDTYSRAVKGGVGEAKAAGNYGASLLACEEAKKEGCTQVLWLDACEHKYVEEVGTSNIFFLIDDELITPPLDGSILAGITRDSVLQLASDWGINAVERKLSIDEVIGANREGRLKEIFATGTAAVISPVGELKYKGEIHQINEGRTGELSERLYTTLQQIQYGAEESEHRWSVRVC